MPNLFQKAAKKAATASKGPKDEKPTIKVEDLDFFNKISDYESLNNEMKALKEKADSIYNDLKKLGKDEYAKLYSKNSKNPGSITLEQTVDENTAHLMFVPSDKYISINEKLASELRENISEKIVEEKQTFSFNNDMIEKYGEVIARLIEESTEIDEDDKEKIIESNVSYSIAKGTIDELAEYGDVTELIEAVKPVFSLKNVEVIKA